VQLPDGSHKSRPKSFAVNINNVQCSCKLCLADYENKLDLSLLGHYVMRIGEQ